MHVVPPVTAAAAAAPTVVPPATVVANKHADREAGGSVGGHGCGGRGGYGRFRTGDGGHPVGREIMLYKSVYKSPQMSKDTFGKIL